MDESCVVSITKTSFTLNDGRIFEFPFELEEVPTLEEFSKIYEGWKTIINDEDKLEQLLNGEWFG